MSNIIPFVFENHSVRVLADDNGEPLFVARDVATALGYTDTVNAIKQHCRGVVERHPIQDSLGRTQEARVKFKTGRSPVLAREASTNSINQQLGEGLVKELPLPTRGGVQSITIAALDCSPEFAALNFELADYIDKNGDPRRM